MNVGLYLGSFNPVHIGHLIVANTMLERTEMDEAWFVVSPQSPMKVNKTLVEDHHRLAMLELATQSNPRFRVCDVELGLPRPSYTVVTLQTLHRLYPQHSFSLIMGGDNIEQFDCWRNYQDILAQHHLYVYPRPGYTAERWAHNEHVHIVECPQMEISSSFIREQIAQNKSVRYILTDSVIEYISSHKLYL